VRVVLRWVEDVLLCLILCLILGLILGLSGSDAVSSWSDVDGSGRAQSFAASRNRAVM
jgi:hypothetical protein